MYLEIDIFRHFCLLYRHFTFLLLFIDILLLSCVCVPCIAFQFIALLFHLSVVSFWVIALLLFSRFPLLLGTVYRLGGEGCGECILLLSNASQFRSRRYGTFLFIKLVVTRVTRGENIFNNNIYISAT